MSESPLPFDPQRPPWAPSGRFRVGYREQLRALDDELIALGRSVVAMAEVLVDLDHPISPDDLDGVRSGFGALRGGAATLEDDAFTLVALESPVAEDLRELVSLIRAVYDVTRSGRLVVHVVEHLHTLEQCGVATGEGDLGRMRRAAHGVFRDAVAAWADRDVLALNDLRTRDDEVDVLRDRLLASDAVCADRGCVVAHVLLVRFLERLADHGVSLTAHLSWAVTGDRVLVRSPDETG